VLVAGSEADAAGRTMARNRSGHPLSKVEHLCHSHDRPFCGFFLVGARVDSQYSVHIKRATFGNPDAPVGMLPRIFVAACLERVTSARGKLFRPALSLAGLNIAIPT